MVGFEEVDAAQQRRLARAGRADDAHDLSAVDGQVDAREDLEVAERLVEVVDLDLVLHQFPVGIWPRLDVDLDLADGLPSSWTRKGRREG